MTFETDTIMGKVLQEVKENKNNKKYLEQIDLLIQDIEEYEFEEYDGPLWNRNGLKITHPQEKNVDVIMMDKKWIYIKSIYAYELSWLVYELDYIYRPFPNDEYRLFTTIGYLLEIYLDKYKDLEIALKMTTIISTIFLHKDHIGFDKFRVYPVDLPNFGSEF